MSSRPDYVDFEPKSRDELLSQIGTFSPVERSLFGKLCEAWQPKIDAQHFLRGASSADQESSALRRLMAKLRTAQLGLLTTNVTANGVMPSAIVLTTRGSIDFWREAIAEETVVESSEARLTLPSEPRLAEKKLTPPGYLITEIDSTQLAQAHAGDIDEKLLLRFRLLDEFKIIFAARSTHLLVNQAFGTLRKDIEERGILDELARVRDTSLTELRTQLHSKNPEAWLENTRTLVKERATIAYRKGIEQTDELFQIAYLVMSFVDARMSLARQSKEDLAAVTDEVKALVKRVAEASGGTFPQSEFEQAIAEAEKRLGSQSRALAKQLEEKVFSPRKSRTLPVLLLVHGVYVHQDNLASIFERALDETRVRLMEEYSQLLEAFMRGRDSDITETLGSRSRLDEDIANRIARIHPLLSEILARPQALAEAVVRAARRTGAAEKQEALKQALSRFFEVEDSRLKPLYIILAIDIPHAFESAFARLSVIRQLLLRISGRYESLRSSYSNRFSTPKKRMRYNEALPAEERESGASASQRAPSATGARSSAGRIRKVTTPQKPKQKSAREIEDLWQEFGKAINTKHED